MKKTPHALTRLFTLLLASLTILSISVAAAGTAGGGALLPPASSFTSSFLGHSGQLLIKFFRVLVTRDKGPP